MTSVVASSKTARALPYEEGWRKLMKDMRGWARICGQSQTTHHWFDRSDDAEYATLFARDTFQIKATFTKCGSIG
jgi:hypothetical protein